MLEDVAEPLVGGAARALNRGRIHINHGHIDPVLDSLVRKADVVEHAFAGVVIGGPAGVVAAVVYQLLLVVHGCSRAEGRGDDGGP